LVLEAALGCWARQRGQRPAFSLEVGVEGRGK
jgi:hypothetical protein